MVLAGRDVMRETLSARRELLERDVLPLLDEPIRYSPALRASLKDLIASVKAQGFEGLVAKRHDSPYESGNRSGAWRKMRISQGQEFVIGGYTIGGDTFDALVFGYYESSKLIYAARTRNGFTPVLRRELVKRFQPLEIKECPFANLPRNTLAAGRGLTAAKMADCRWLKPALVGQFEFIEWTPDRICASYCTSSSTDAQRGSVLVVHHTSRALAYLNRPESAFGQRNLRRYSALSATTGSTLAARRAGI